MSINHRKRDASGAAAAARSSLHIPNRNHNYHHKQQHTHILPSRASPHSFDGSPTPKRSKRSPEYVLSSASEGGSESEGEGASPGHGGSDSGYVTRQNFGLPGYEDFRAPRNRTISESGRPAPWPDREVMMLYSTEDIETETRSTSPVCGGSPGPTSPSPGPSTPVAQASHCSTAPVWSAAASPSPAPAAGLFTPPSPSYARPAMASSSPAPVPLPAQPATASPMSTASPPAQPTLTTATASSPAQPTPTATTASPPQPVTIEPPPPQPALRPASTSTPTPTPPPPPPPPRTHHIAFVSQPEIIQAPHYSQYSQLSQQSLSQYSDKSSSLPSLSQLKPPPPQRPLFLLPTPSSDYVRHNPLYPAIVRELETAPISNSQLVAETKSIYSGLSLIEAKVIEVVAQQNQVLAAAQSTQGTTAAVAAAACAPSMEQWRALVSLHRTLLQEHHDFLLASQHPAASPALRRVAHKYAMPARLWRHGIHGFLELLRRHLPASREPMESFLYMAYSMLALLVETVPGFEDTWIECLGDVARYRMAIEEASQHTRDVWTAVARRWYTVASDHAPATGRLYHHLGILARPRIVAQLFWYVKALCVGVPFVATRESILTLLEPALHHSNTQPMIQAAGGGAVELAFVRSHGLLFLRAHPTPAGRPASAWADATSPTTEAARIEHLKTLLAGLDTSVHRNGRSWIAVGAQMAVVNSCALLQYGADGNPLLRLLKQAAGDMDGAEGAAKQQQQEQADPTPPTADAAAVAALAPAYELVQAMDRIVLARVGDAHTYGYAHVRLVFLEMAARLPSLMAYVEHTVPWAALALYLNGMLLAYRHAADAKDAGRIEQEVIMEAPPPYDSALSLAARAAAVATAGPSFAPTPAVTTQDYAPPPPRATRPLPEDWALQCLLFADRLFPADWFAGQDGIDDGERLLEAGSMVVQRMERCLWLAVRLAWKGGGQWLTYEDGQFGVAERWRAADEANE